MGPRIAMPATYAAASNSPASNLAAVGVDDQAAQRLEQLRQRWSRCNEIRLKSTGNVDRIRQEQAQAEKEASAEFGTADLDELRAQLFAARESNNRALEDFEQNIAQAEAGLREIGVI